MQEDAPAEKVLNHFFHGKDGSAFSIGVGNTASDNRAMTLFNESVSLMSGYDESAKQISFFVFGQSLHHVEDMYAPAHAHNDTENILFVPILRCRQLKNTHVVNSTLRFLNYPRLVLKQTGSFSEVLI